MIRPVLHSRPLFSGTTDYTMGTLNIWYLFGRYSHGGGALNKIEFAVKTINGSVTLDWALFSVNADGTPNQQIASGSLTPAVGWNTIDLSGNPPTLDARTWYYFGVRLTAGTSIVIPVIDSQHQVMMDTPPSTLYTWDGSTLTRVKGQCAWNIQCGIGGNVYGNPFTHLALNTFYAAGNSYVLSESVPLVGAYIASAQTTEQNYAYTIRLYECNTSFIPTNLLESVTALPKLMQDSTSNAQLYVEFSQVYTLSRFSIVVVQTTATIRSRENYDGYSGNSNRKNYQYGFVKMITSSDGNNYSVRQTSGCDCMYVMMPVFGIGGSGGGGGGSPIIINPFQVIT